MAVEDVRVDAGRDVLDRLRASGARRGQHEGQ
jgi:hypothetical protein